MFYAILQYTILHCSVLLELYATDIQTNGVDNFGSPTPVVSIVQCSAAYSDSSFPAYCFGYTKTGNYNVHCSISRQQFSSLLFLVH